MYLNAAQDLIERNATGDLLSCLSLAARDFNQIAVPRDVPKVGIVGEIYLKFNPFAQKDISEWLVSRQIEVVPPLLTESGFVCPLALQPYMDAHGEIQQGLSGIPLFCPL